LAQEWLLNVPVFKIKGVKLSNLMKRGRNIRADMQEADLKIKAMKDPLGRTVEDVNAKKNSPEWIIAWDGIPVSVGIFFCPCEISTKTFFRETL